MSYVGRFAPSPTGPLHLGSLLAALASYLETRNRQGRWLLRIDDLDTPRVVAGADRHIVETLAAYGMRADGELVYQSDRRSAYGQALSLLQASGQAFDCGCTRREAQSGAMGVDGPVYPGTCRSGLPRGRRARSVRSRITPGPITFLDRIQGEITQDLSRDVGDFVIRRADGLTAYQLATVLDDAFQGVTDVVRGADLLNSTPRQIHLQQCLSLPMLTYAHVPVLVDQDGQKLGKSTGALALDETARSSDLWRCLAWLGQQPPETLCEWSVADIIAWGVDHWQLANVPAKVSLSAL